MPMCAGRVDCSIDFPYNANGRQAGQVGLPLATCRGPRHTMTPTDFTFTLTMPGDERLIGAVRQLAAQAAGYAQLTGDAVEGWAGHVDRATQAAIAAAAPPPTPIQLRFSGDGRALDVVITAEGAKSAALPRSLAVGDVRIDWSADGSRLTCHIRQPLPA
jgi:hypothetical protein